MKSIPILLLGLLGAAGCAEEFDPYNQVQGLRVLALRADSPDVEPGAQATIDALVTADASYQWTWCPLSYSGDNLDQCPISEFDLSRLVEAAGGEAPPPYDLGTDPSVVFEHTLPPDLLRAICENAEGAELPEGIPTPTCDGRFDVSIRVTVSDGEETVAGLRNLALIYDDAVVPNTNPSIAAGEISVRGAPPFELSQEQPTTVSREVEYRLALDVDESQAESYATVDEAGEPTNEREILVVTWFYESGEMDKTRSSFIEGATDFENLTTNRFRTPAVDEEDSDSSRLYFVIRDDRGGIGWFTSDLELVND